MRVFAENGFLTGYEERFHVIRQGAALRVHLAKKDPFPTPICGARLRSSVDFADLGGPGIVPVNLCDRCYEISSFPPS